jgi:hypothetical protein
MCWSTRSRHGNEICGAIVVDRLLREGLRPTRGRSRSPSPTSRRFALRRRRTRSAAFVDEDFNRVWTPAVLDGTARQRGAARARAVAAVRRRARFLLDIHSMLEPSPPVMICGPLDKGIRFAFEVGVPEHVVSDTGHANGTRMRDYGGFGDPASPTQRAAGGVRPALGAQMPSGRLADALWRFLTSPRRGRSAPGRAARSRTRRAAAEADSRHRSA